MSVADRNALLDWLDVGAYYYSFEKTGDEHIDRILGAVCRAGKNHHNTQDWTEAGYCGQVDGKDVSCIDVIQNAANEAAAARRVAQREGDDSKPIDTKRTLEQNLTALLNTHSQEAASNTPDFILARYLLDCLAAYNAAQVRSTEWHAEPRTATPKLSDLRFSVRTWHVLENLGINTLEELCATRPSVLRKARNFGPRSYQEVVLALSKVGRSLAPEKGHRER